MAARRPAQSPPLAGVRVVEMASFVAVPLAGMTLAQLGCDVVRVDPIGGAADYRRWPLSDQGVSIYWTGLNKGKRSLAVDLRSADGQRLVQQLVVESGILLTNMAGRRWHSWETLAACRPDLIHLEVLGRGDGTTAVDYTVNAATGFPMVTGPAGHDAPINHVLPAWDVACGLHAALAVTAAIHRRDTTGKGSRISLALQDVALSTASALGFLTEAMVNNTGRERIGNAVYGQYGQTFTSSDGAAFMVVTLTPRHFRDLTALTGTDDAVAQLSQRIGADFTDEGQRYLHRAELTRLFEPWFAERTADRIEAAMSATSLLWERYRSFADVATDPALHSNPMFVTVDQGGVGQYLAAGSPAALDGTHAPARPAPALGGHSRGVLRDLGISDIEIDRLVESGTVDDSAAPVSRS